MKKPIFEMKNVHKTFHKDTANEQHVLKGIDLKIYPGDFINVIGGNGSGKSTLLNSIAGTFELDQGELTLGDKTIQQLKEYQRAKWIGRVFQDPHSGTSPRMSILENLSIAHMRGRKRSFLNLATKKDDKESFAKEVAQLSLGLEDRLDTEIGLLSGGQRQGITLLMAVLNQPDLLLLDEHTAALDPKTAASIMDKTNRLIQENQLTALMVTHQLQDAIDYGNRLIMMRAGNIIFDVSGAEKAALTVDDLYELFKKEVI